MSDTSDFGHDSGSDDLGHSGNPNNHHDHTYKEPNFAVHSEYNADIHQGNIFKFEQLLNTGSENVPKIIGLTGGIGSGKTTVAGFIEEFGFPVYYSDERAKDIVNDNPDLKLKIKNLLGEDAYDENGLYDRKFVAEKVFNDKDLLQKLNEIIHPAVRVDFEDWVKKQTKYLIFKETALLFELKLNLECYKSILVTAEDNIRIKRVMDRDGKTYREVQSVMEKQMPEKDKIKLADCIIYNNTNLEDLKVHTEKVIFDIE